MKPTNQTEKQEKRKEILMFILMYTVCSSVGLILLFCTNNIYFALFIGTAIYAVWYYIREKLKQKRQKDLSNNPFNEDCHKEKN